MAPRKSCFCATILKSFKIFWLVWELLEFDHSYTLFSFWIRLTFWINLESGWNLTIMDSKMNSTMNLTIMAGCLNLTIMAGFWQVTVLSSTWVYKPSRPTDDIVDKNVLCVPELERLTNMYAICTIFIEIVHTAQCTQYCTNHWSLVLHKNIDSRIVKKTINIYCTQCRIYRTNLCSKIQKIYCVFLSLLLTIFFSIVLNNCTYCIHCIHCTYWAIVPILAHNCTHCSQ